MKRLIILMVAVSLAPPELINWRSVSTWLSRVYPERQTVIERMIEKHDYESNR